MVRYQLVVQEYHVCIIYWIRCFVYFLNIIEILLHTCNVTHVFHLFETSRVGSLGCREWVVMANVAKFCFCALENVC